MGPRLPLPWERSRERLFLDSAPTSCSWGALPREGRSSVEALPTNGSPLGTLRYISLHCAAGWRKASR